MNIKNNVITNEKIQSYLKKKINSNLLNKIDNEDFF